MDSAHLCGTSLSISVFAYLDIELKIASQIQLKQVFFFLFLFSEKKTVCFRAILNQGRSVQITHEQSVLLYSLPSPWVKKKNISACKNKLFDTTSFPVFRFHFECSMQLGTHILISISTIFFAGADFMLAIFPQELLSTFKYQALKSELQSAKNARDLGKLFTSRNR